MIGMVGVVGSGVPRRAVAVSPSGRKSGVISGFVEQSLIGAGWSLLS